MNRVEVGELLYLPRLEKICRNLQGRMRDLMGHNQRVPCELQFSTQINHYAKMILVTVIDTNNEQGGEYFITGLIYSIELTEHHHIIIVEETDAELCSPLIIIARLLAKLDKYDIKNLYFCKYCDRDLVEKGKECCEPCQMTKITYHEMCAICQDDDYRILPSVWAKLECNHVFHRHCILQIKPYIQKRIKCPLCRNEQEAWSAVL